MVNASRQRLSPRNILLACALAPAAIYAVDAAAWHVRNARGNGVDQVAVAQVTAATLKRNREEYYFDGTITITCARSLFPQWASADWVPPCWYVRRHPTQVDHL